MIQFYLAPYQAGYVETRPQANASKCIIYPHEECTAVKANPWKNWCLCRVNTTEAVHAQIRDDPEITLIPFFDSANDYLGLQNTVSEIDATRRQQIVTYLENHHIPTEWIRGDMTIGQVLKRLIFTLFIVQRMRDDYPEYDLETKVNAIPSAQRGRILTWMQNHGVATEDINSAWTVRQVLERIVSQCQGVPWPKKFGVGGEL